MQLLTFAILSEDAEIVSSSIDAAAAKLRDQHVAYLVEGSNINTEESTRSAILHGMVLDLVPGHSFSKPVETSTKDLPCSYFLSKRKDISLSAIREVSYISKFIFCICLFLCG